MFPSQSSVEEEKKLIEKQAREYGVDAERLSAMVGVGRWYGFLRAPDARAREVTRIYMEQMGYLPDDKRIATMALRGAEKLKDTALELIDLFRRGALDPEKFLELGIPEIRGLSPGITAPQAALLRSIVARQLQLDTLDLSDLKAQFPFPITDRNFFGRFIASRCKDPSAAARHLRLSIPFFVRLKSLLEQLSVDEWRLVSVKVGEQEGGNSGKEPFIDKNWFGDSIREVLRRIPQFTAGQLPGIEPFTLIPLPRLPRAEIAGVKRTHWDHLAGELFDWLLLGDRSGKLLNMVRLPAKQEAEYRRVARRKNLAEALLKKHQATERPAARPERRRWEARERVLQQRIKKLARNMERYNVLREESLSILENLEADRSLLRAIERVRSSVREAQKNGSRIVFSLWNHHASDRTDDPFYYLFDTACSSRLSKAHRGLVCLQKASFLLTPEVADLIQRHAGQAPGSFVQRNLCTVSFDPRDIHGSVETVLAALDKNAPHPRMALLSQVLTDNLDLNLHPAGRFRLMVKHACGKKNPDVSDYLMFAFSRATNVSQENLLDIFGVLVQEGVREIPRECVELLERRFHHKPEFFSQFHEYARKHIPAEVGEPPEIFELLTGFDNYLDGPHKGFGVRKEVEELERLLSEHGVVAILDETNYYPEASAGEEEDDDDDDDEGQSVRESIWGGYTPPAQRIVRSFAHRMMSGAVPEEIRNSSLLAVRDEIACDDVSPLLSLFLGIHPSRRPNLRELNDLLSELTLFNERSIVVMDAQMVQDVQLYREFLDRLKESGVKVVLRTRAPFPGVPHVLVQPFLERDLQLRLTQEAGEMANALRLSEPPGKEVLRFVAEQVHLLRQPSEDPLDLAMTALQSAAEHARNAGASTITESDAVAGLSNARNLPSGEQLRRKIAAIDDFAERAPVEVLGQPAAIKQLAQLLKLHSLQLRDMRRPLAVLLTGPTGVGKTQLMMRAALALDMPFYLIDGSQFSEPHSISRLIGSPAGYVGKDQGPLYRFLKENPAGLTFIDEIEKMHPEVYQALLQFFDRATLIAGDGETTTRPGHIIVGASNAGADELRPGMSKKEVLDILSKAFVDQNGRPRPELVRRFEVIPMLALEESAFHEVIRTSLSSVGLRYGLIRANLKLAGVDDSALSLVYKDSCEACAFNESAYKTRAAFFNQDKKSSMADLYYDMRFVNRAIDRLAGDAILACVEEQYRSGRYNERSNPTLIELVGDAEREVILVRKISEAP